MRNTIGLKITGNEDIIKLPDLVQAISDWLELIIEVDVSLSPDFKPTIDWRLKALSYSSPVQIVAESVTKEDRPDNRVYVIDTIFSGTESLAISNKRPTGFSDKALEKARDLAKSRLNGIDKIEIILDEMEFDYVSNIAENVNVILKPGRVIYGSVEGQLERMNSHGDFNFHIFEPILIRRVKCELANPKDTILKEKVISLYEHDVIVSGLLNTNINGEVTSAKIEYIEGRKVAPLLKDASEVTGIWDFLGGGDPTEHIRRLRE